MSTRVMSKARAFLRRTRPNRLGPGKLAMVEVMPTGAPGFRAWMPFRATQLVGGRHWSLSLIRTGEVTGHARGTGPVDRQIVDEALDALACEHCDPHEAADLLRRALGHYAA